MSNDFRETTIRVFDVERVVRTERKGSVKQLEAKHTKAVKDSITSLRLQRIEATHNVETATEDGASARDAWLKFHLNGRQGPLTKSDMDAMESTVRYSLSERERHARAVMEKICKDAVPKNVPYTDLRDSLRYRAIKYTDPTTYLVEVAPGHFATADAAEELTLC
jgi:hypothetical protein